MFDFLVVDFLIDGLNHRLRVTIALAVVKDRPWSYH
jgi:hypothetical protein